MKPRDLDAIRERLSERAPNATINAAFEDRRVLVELADELIGELARLTAAHDHQHAVAGTLLREAERVSRQRDAAVALLQETRTTTLSRLVNDQWPERRDAFLAKLGDQP